MKVKAIQWPGTGLLSMRVPELKHSVEHGWAGIALSGIGLINFGLDC